MKHGFVCKFISSVGALAAGLALLPGRAEACGGFFCSQQQGGVNQAAERIIFADNGDGTVTAVIQILYQGPSDHFSWLLPISTVPQGDQLAVASDLAFTRLQAATNPQFNLTTQFEGCDPTFAAGNSAVDIAPAAETCVDNPLLAGCNGNSVSVQASGVVGEFEWSVIRVTDPGADPTAPAVDWLRQNGYDVTPEGAALIGPYLADGMNLLALKLVKGADSGSIRPIVLTYSAEAPMIPIKLTAVAANQDMGVMTWALSSARAVPFNYSALELNEARINWFNASSNYNEVVTEAADAAGGQGFVTEFAGPSAQLAGVIWSASDEQNWQSVRSTTYSAFEGLFSTLWSNYQSFDGFWDGVRKAVTLPEGLSFSDFKSCPNCYARQIQFSPTLLFDAVEASAIEPMRSVQGLFDRSPYTTRLYSTLSAAEMTLDPVFVFNPDLPDVSNVHQARRVIECGKGGGVQGPWRIELPQGSVLRGTAATAGTWPVEVAAQPANLRVSMLSRSGAGRVLDDNSDEINTELAVYNARVPSRQSVAPNAGSYEDSGGGFCSLRGSPGSSGLPRGGRVPLVVALSGLLGAACLRRRRR